MTEKNKNVLIGGLLAIVLVMAVGYAAFATQLTINGTAEVSSSWDVHFDTSKTSGTDVISTNTGLTNATAPSGTVAYGSNLQATLTTTLNQPGDSVTYTLTIINAGTLKAQAATPSLSIDNGKVDGLTATSTSGLIKYTVTEPTPNVIAANNGTATMTVKAEYVSPKQNVTTSTEKATLKVTLDYSQSVATS